MSLPPVPPEFSLAIMKNMVPRPLDWFIGWWGGCGYTHVAIRIDYKGEPYVYHCHPPWGPMKKNGVNRHSWREYNEVVIPYWESWPWAKRRGGIHHRWLAPSKEITPPQAESARWLADWLADSSGIKYGLLLNYLFQLPGYMHCSEFVNAVATQIGLGTNKGARTTPCDLLWVYENGTP